MFKTALIILTSCFLLKVIYLLYIYVRKVVILNRIPGPPGLPILGNALDICVSADKLWHYFKDLSVKYYPIYRIQSVYHIGVQLLHPEDIEKVISGTKNLTKSRIYDVFTPWLQTGLLTSTGSKWKSRRKILTPAFHFSILQVFMRIFIEKSELLLKQIENECTKKYTEVLPLLAEFTLHSICESSLGTRLNSKKKHHASYVQAIYKMGELIINRIVRPWLHTDTVYYFSRDYKDRNRIIKYLHDFSMSVIQKRKQSFNEDDKLENLDDINSKKKLALLDVLISAQKNGVDIDDDGIREEVDTFIFEGYDTTLTCLSFTLMILANHPEIQNKVVDELNSIFLNSNRPPTYQDIQNMIYLEMVIKESLRMYPSVPFIARTTDQEIVTKDGYVIPSGTSIHIFIHHVHMNPEIYPNPKKFDPYRFLPENSKKRHHFAYLPFSAGPRNCIGQKYAMVELKVALSAILRHFVLELVDKQDDLILMMNMILRTKDPIKVKFSKRKN
ncbi:hypothetical protein RN001_015834 [Aquatica leii]|uniref:Cytochrome P450 n=1 Tax=Aquatica leii TaxID=1421715 RepID=A0AAN7SMV9_9COLE|nr:hypothetical protein RN001_015834 [Aquatica leii]